MKVQFLSLLMAASSLVFTACGNDNKSNTAANADADTLSNSTESSTATGTAATAGSPIQEVVDHYLHVKNALANDNGQEAANGAKSMAAALGKVDHASMAQDKMKLYMDVAESLKEHAEHTAANAGKIDHQREHFVLMSDDVHELVKTFGSTKTLYLDHCPMANNDKGANWISETEEIKNPYMGKKMPKCGKVEHVIK